MYRNTLTQFVFDRELRLLDCNYSANGLWGKLAMKKSIGKSISDLYQYVAGHYPKLADTILESLKTAQKENHTVYRECSVKLETDNLFIMVLVTVHEKTLQMNCVQMQEQDALKTIQTLSKISKSIVFSYVIGNESIEIFGDNEDSEFQTHEFKYDEYIQTIHPDDREDYVKKTNDVYEGKVKTLKVEVRINSPRHAGEYRYYEVILCLTSKEKEKKMVVGIVRDIQEEKEAEQKREEYLIKNRMILNNVPVGIEIYDENACLMWVNKKELEHFGLTPETVPYGYCLYEHPYLNEAQKEMIRRREAFSMVLPYNFDYADIRNFLDSGNHGIRYFDIRFTPLTKDDGTFYGYMSVNMDTTEIHYNNSRLEQLSRNLDLAMTAGDVAAWIYYPDQKLFKTLKGNAIAGDGMTWEENFQKMHPDDIKEQRDALQSLLDMKVRKTCVTCRYMHSDGTYHSYESYMMADELNGRIVSITGTDRDVTDQLKANENKRRLMQRLTEYNKMLSKIIDNIPSLLTIKDVTEDYTFTTVNHNFLEVVGRKQEDFIGKPLRSIYPKKISDFYITGDQEAIEKNCVTEREEHLTIRGREYYWKAVRAPMKLDNGHTYVIDIYTDITSLKYANMDLTKAKEKAEQSDQLKSKFLANMSHEIRTPLNAIVGFSEVLNYAESDAEREEYFDIIRKNSQQLLRLINDILDLSKIEAGTMTISNEWIDAKELIHDAVATTSCGLNGKPIMMYTDIPYSECRIEFDKYRYTQILNNYLSNAVKYTEKGAITVFLECKENGVKVKVSDTGIGIAEENFDRVFGRFNKFDEFAQGTGLGLSICKAIADTIGGEVGFDSKQGEGSTFWAWIPCKVEAKALSKPKKDLPILIAEDDESNFKLAEVNLRPLNVVHAHDGAEAVELMKTQQFAVVLMDIRMPNMDGIEATKKIREFDKETPIIAVTAYNAQKDAAMAAGCNDFITKPVKEETICLQLEKYL